MVDDARQNGWGVLAEFGDPAWAAKYPGRYPGEREVETYIRLCRAVEALQAGARADTPRAAPPAWLMPTVRKAIADGTGFEYIRRLELAGLVALAHDDAYVRAWMGSLTQHRQPRSIDHIALLRGNPLLPLLWRVFEVQPDELGITQHDAYVKDVGSWAHGYATLSAAGLLEREPLLDRLLQSLRGDLRQAPARWYAALWSRLAVTDNELAARQAGLCDLLRSAMSTTVGLGLDGLIRLDGVGRLDDEHHRALTPGLRTPTKKHALATLRLLRTIRNRRPDLTSSLNDVVAGGLSHPDADVQRTAAKLLSDWGAPDRVAASAHQLAAPVRLELGVTDVVAPPRTPVVAPAPAAPVADDRTAAELVACVLESAADPLDVELMLAAAGQLVGPDSLAPLAKRARTILKKAAWETWWSGPTRWTAWLVLEALNQPYPDLTLARPARADLTIARFEAVAARLRRQRPPVALLATPTTTDGLLDLPILADRLATAADPALPDLIAATLRLDTRGADPDLIRGDNEIASALRYALGAPGPQPSSITTPALWVAASRTRAPHREDPSLLAAGLDRAGQGRPIRASLRIVPDDRFSWVTGQWCATVDVEHAASDLLPLQPTATDCRRDDWTSTLAWAPVIALGLPHDLDPALLDPIRVLFYEASSSGVNELVTDARHVLGMLGRYPGSAGSLTAPALAAGLNGAHRTVRVQAVDVTADYLNSDRVSPQDLAGAMVTIQQVAVLGRWADSLADLGQITGRAAVDVLITLLPSLPPDRRDLHRVVELLLSESLRTGVAIDDPALRQWLASLTGKGKAPTAARTLLAL